MRALVIGFLVATGCTLNEGSDCLGDSPEELRDPRTGSCVDVGDADACRYCSYGEDTCVIADVGALDHARCDGACSSYAEPACLQAPGCRAAYDGGGFLECWSMAPSGPARGGGCAGLDAHECSRHDDCAAWYVHLSDGSMDFDHCGDEPAPTSRASLR